MSSNKSVPHVVSIIVYGAKGLKPKKDKHKFCVIFGVGKSKCRTDIVEDLFDNPVFNKEAEITVDNLDLELKFKVTEKHEKNILGQVTVPLYELGEQSMSSPHKVPLRPHKKCPTPNGMLIFEAWVTEKKAEKVVSRATSLESLKSIKSLGISSSLKRLKDRINISGKSTDDKTKKNSSESLFSLKSRSAVSCQDITRQSPFIIPGDRHSLHSDTLEPLDFRDAISELEDDYSLPKRNSIYLDKVSEFSCPQPEVTSVSPKSGPETGGTILTIRGSNLGQNQEDIVALNVCGSDVLETLEYISPWKLQCKTLPSSPCAGSINIETLSGGRGTSLVEFTFDEVEKPKPLRETKSESCFLETSLSYISEERKSEASNQFEDQYDQNEYAVPYSDDRVRRNSFQIETLDSKRTSTSTTPSGKSPQVYSGEGGAIRLRVGGHESKPTKNEEDETLQLEKRRTGVSDDITTDIINVTPVSKEVVDLVQNDVGREPVKILVGQDKTNGKITAASTGPPVKLPPPVVEIQPMRMEDKHIGTRQGKGSNGNPPQKPPRQFPDRRNFGENSVDDTPSIFQIIEQEDVHPEKNTHQENEQIKDLEMQLSKKTNEIEMLVKLKKHLVDENWRLKQYIEVLVMRAIKICPEVLCVDDSVA